MQPLSPKDLLIRQSPVEADQWDPASQAEQQSIPVTLERFQTLERTIADNPLHADPYLELAKIYLTQERWHDARRVLDLAHKRFSDNEEVNYLREEAQLARSLQLFTAAEVEYAQEPTQLTEDNLQRCRVELNVLRERVCLSRLERHPEQVELNLPLATAMENLGKRDEAIGALKPAIEQPQLRAEASLQLGYMLERARRVPEALSAFRRAALFRVPPPSPEIKFQALMAAADLAQRSNMIDSARRYVAMLIEISPNNVPLKNRLEELNQMSL
ncbi:MAG: tetratricopeptide repeat protein [Pirellulaceae bacterium]